MSDLIRRADAIHILACEMYAEAQAEGYDTKLEDYIPEAKAWMNDAPSDEAVSRESYINAVNYVTWLEKLIVDSETFEWLCEDTKSEKWCVENCNYSSIQSECLRHLYEAEQVTGKLKNPCDSLLAGGSDTCKESGSKLDLISRADAIEAVASADETNGTVKVFSGFEVIDILNALPSADRELANLKEGFESDDAEWIPCSERLPKELETVNVTWVNHNPPVYYQHIKGVPKVDTAVNYRDVWYWWDSTICDVLYEYGEKCGAEPIDKDIEVLAWQPLPKPYREESEVEE